MFFTTICLNHLKLMGHTSSKFVVRYNISRNSYGNLFPRCSIFSIRNTSDSQLHHRCLRFSAYFLQPSAHQLLRVLGDAFLKKYSNAGVIDVHCVTYAVHTNCYLCSFPCFFSSYQLQHSHGFADFQSRLHNVHNDGKIFSCFSF